MARPRQFDRDQALQQAIDVFCEHGYAASSTDELMQAMGLGRQSMYNAFGDKRQLYLEALRRYNTESAAELIRHLGAPGSPRAALEQALLAFVARVEREGRTGCMGVNAICEFGRSDEEISLLGEAAGKAIAGAFAQVVRRGQQQGEIDPRLDADAAAEFLLANLSGLKLAAKSGAPVARLREIARFALRGLAAQPAAPAATAAPRAAKSRARKG